MGLYRVNDGFDLVQLTVEALESSGGIELGLFEQLVGFQHKCACGRQSSSVTRFKINQALVTDTLTAMVELAALGSKLHGVATGCGVEGCRRRNFSCCPEFFLAAGAMVAGR